MIKNPDATKNRAAIAVAASPVLTGFAVLLADLLSLTAAGVLAVALRRFFGGQLDPAFYGQLWPVIGLFVLVYFAVGLYPGTALAPAEELRRLSMSTTVVYLVLGASTFIFREAETFSRGVFLLGWVFSLFLVPLGRAALREAFSKRPWWGQAVIVYGAGRTGQMVLRALARQPGLGLKVAAVFDDDPDKHGVLEGVPVLGGVSEASSLGASLGIRYAIVAMPGVRRDRLLELIERHTGAFPHLILIPDLFGFSSLWVTAADLGGVLGLEIRQRLLLPGPRLLKRAIDLSAAVLGGLAIVPLLALIALLVRLDSPGPVFYGHTRIGQGGRRFKAWKFRSMVQDADRVLEEYLHKHPELRTEWEETQKLKNDPRVTRVGRWLRKLSLDELPQLWNVIKGEMSLVGPRPVVQSELAKYGEKGALYLKVKPGMTGLWQVSGRSETTYEERVEMDAYYVRNWSVWLDLYILARTVWVVLFGRGAY